MPSKDQGRSLLQGAQSKWNSVFSIFGVPLPAVAPKTYYAFRFDEWMHWFALVTNTQHLRAGKGCQSPVKFYVEKLLMMPSGPVSFWGENELLRQTCRSCKPFVIRKWSMQQGKLAKLKDSVALMKGWYYQWKSNLPTSWIISSSQWALLAENHRTLRN